MKTFFEQFNEYRLNGGSMTIDEWEHDGRFDKSLVTVKNQIIVNSDGHSWLGFYSSDKKLNERLLEILAVSKKNQTGNYKNTFWVLDMDGSCVAVQPQLKTALRYYTNKRILVHTESTFI